MAGWTNPYGAALDGTAFSKARRAEEEFALNQSKAFFDTAMAVDFRNLQKQEMQDRFYTNEQLRAVKQRTEDEANATQATRINATNSINIATEAQGRLNADKFNVNRDVLTATRPELTAAQIAAVRYASRIKQATADAGIGDIVDPKTAQVFRPDGRGAYYNVVSGLTPEESAVAVRNGGLAMKSTTNANALTGQRIVDQMHAATFDTATGQYRTSGGAITDRLGNRIEPWAAQYGLQPDGAPGKTALTTAIPGGTSGGRSVDWVERAINDAPQKDAWRGSNTDNTVFPGQESTPIPPPTVSTVVTAPPGSAEYFAQSAKRDSEQRALAQSKAAAAEEQRSRARAAQLEKDALTRATAPAKIRELRQSLGALEAAIRDVYKNPNYPQGWHLVAQYTRDANIIRAQLQATKKEAIAAGLTGVTEQ